MSQIIKFFVSAAVLLSAVIAGANNKEQTNEANNQADDLGSFCVRGLWNSREQLRSGAVHCSYVLTDKQHEENSMSLQLFLAFDYTNRSVRYDRQPLDKEKSQFVRTLSYTLLHLPGSGVIATYAPDYKVARAEAQVFDTRILGLSQLDEWPLVSYEKMKGFLQTVSLTEVKRDGSKYRLQWTHDFGPNTSKGQMRAQRTIVIDPDQGFSPLHMEEALKWPNEQFGVPDFIADVTYRNISNCWVPTLCKFENRKVGEEQSAVLELAWDSVNQPLDKQIFEAQGLDAPGGTLVADMRLGNNGIVESMIPRTGKNDLPGGPTRLLGRTELTRSWRSYFFIGLNISIVILLIVLIAYRRFVTKAGRVSS